MNPVSPALAREIFHIEFWHFAALAASLSVNVFFYRNAEKGPLLYRYLAVQGAAALWILSKILKTVAPTEALRWLFIVSQYLGISFLGPFFLFFAWQHRFREPAPRALRKVLYALGVLLFALVATNPRHLLFYSRYDFGGDDFGPLFAPFMYAVYAQVVAASGLCALGLRTRSVVPSDALIGSTAALPLAVNALYAFGHIRPLFDPTPLAITSSLALVGLAAFRSHFLGLLPIARDQLVSTLRDPLALTDRRGRVRRSFLFPPGAALGDELAVGDAIYRRLRTRRLGSGTLHHYVDVSELAGLQRRFAEGNAELEASIARLQEANKRTVARIEAELLSEARRELHDILGHSLTTALLLLRAARRKSETERARAVDAAKDILDGGMDELRRGFRGSVSENEILSISLQELVESAGLREAALDFAVGGRERALPPRVVAALAACCREAITNSLKHGGSARVSLSLLYGERSLAVVVADGGRGCARIDEGNGLAFLRGRAEAVGASVRFWSEPGEGFQTTIELPYAASPSCLPAAAPAY